jgi:hypothetical protein
LLVVLYGCETWSVTLKEEYKLRLLQNRLLRKVFGPKRNEVTEEWRRLRKEELYDLYKILSDQTKKNEMGGTCSMYGGEERCMQGFGGEI